MRPKVKTFEEIRTGFDPDQDITFDLPKARIELNSPDPVSAILRGHLYIEHTLDKMVTMELKRPGLLNLQSINFSTKAKLCAAMGIIDERTRNLCLKINKLRNALAHRLEGQITESDFKELIGEYHPELRESFLKSMDEEIQGSKSARTPALMTAILLRDFVGILQLMRRQYEISLDRRAVAMEVAREVLQEYCQLYPTEEINKTAHEN